MRHMRRDNELGKRTTSKTNQWVTPPSTTNKSAISAEELRVPDYEGGCMSVREVVHGSTTAVWEGEEQKKEWR